MTYPHNTGAAKLILQNVQAMRAGVDPKTLKKKATKKSTSLAPNFRKTEELKQKEKEELEKRKAKESIAKSQKRNNRNTSISSERNNSLPRINKNIMSGGNTSPPKIKKSKSGGVMSPTKKRSSNNNNNRSSVRKSRSNRNLVTKDRQEPSTMIDPTEPSPMFSIGKPKFVSKFQCNPEVVEGQKNWWC